VNLKLKISWPRRSLSKAFSWKKPVSRGNHCLPGFWPQKSVRLEAASEWQLMCNQFWYSVSIITAIFPHEPGLADYIGAKDKMCKAPVKSLPSTNQPQTFYRPDALPVAQPAALKHWRVIFSNLLVNVNTVVTSNICVIHYCLTVLQNHYTCKMQILLVERQWTCIIWVQKMPEFGVFRCWEVMENGVEMSVWTLVWCYVK